MKTGDIQGRFIRVAAITRLSLDQSPRCIAGLRRSALPDEVRGSIQSMHVGAGTTCSSRKAVIIADNMWARQRHDAVMLQHHDATKVLPPRIGWANDHGAGPQH